VDPVTIGVVGVFVLGGAGAVVAARRSREARERRELADALAEGRRWQERLGGQVLNLSGGDDVAARQALADAAERYTAAGSQLEQATSVTQAALARQSALEGLYYVRAARQSLGLDPGPDLPLSREQQTAGQVHEERLVDIDGRPLRASPAPSPATTHYYPGGVVAGRPVPGGWYSEPFWQTALRAGAWGLGSALVFDTLFGGWGGYGGWGGGYGVFGTGYDAGFDSGYAEGLQDAGSYDQDAGDGSGAYDDGYDAGDSGGGDFSGGDFSGGDFGGGDF
jgi:hypothetical protein